MRKNLNRTINQCYSGFAAPVVPTNKKVYIMRALGIGIVLAWVLLTTLIFLTSCGKTDDGQVRDSVVRPVKSITLSDAPILQIARYSLVLDIAQSFDFSFQVDRLFADLAVADSLNVREGDVNASRR